MKIKNVFVILLLLILIVLLAGCANNDENEELKKKTDASIKYLDNSLISILNKLNNISFESYYVTTEKVKLDPSSESGSDTGSSSKSSEVSNQQEEKGETESGKDTNGGEDGKKDNTKITVSDMKSKNIILSDRTNIDWEQIKSESENLYSTWNSIIIDLYKLGISNDNILKFSEFLDTTLTNVKSENRVAALVSTSNLYNILPSFIEGYSNDRTRINLQWTKAHIINSYSAVGNGIWNTVISEVYNADQSYSAVMTDAEFINSKSYNANKTYITLKELQSSLDLQDEDIFYIKYKNFMEEINML